MLRVRELAFITTAAMTAMTAAMCWPAIRSEAPTASAATIPAKPTKTIVLARMQPRPLPAPAVAPAKIDSGGGEDDDEDVPPPPPIASEAELDAQAGQVGDRMLGRIPPAAMRYFDVFLYVSKAGEGPWSQHMFVFHRADNGNLVYEKNFPVSTGRERHEKYFTTTPGGIFELDPYRFEPMHYSHRWHGAPMAWSMFLNYAIHDHMVGIALHSAGPHVPELGHRASGGCVRLPPEEASLLYHRFQAEERGMVPVWAVDATGTTSNRGEMVRGPSGDPQMTQGYKVLLVIEDYPGGPALVAVLS